MFRDMIGHSAKRVKGEPIMLIDIGDDVSLKKILHFDCLRTVIFDRRRIKPGTVPTIVTNGADLLDVLDGLVKEPGRDPHDFLEVFLVGRSDAKFETIQASLHALLSDLRSGKTPVGGQEHIGSFKVFFKPSDSSDQPLGVDEGLTDVERRDFYNASLAHLGGDALEKAPIQISSAILTKLKGTESATIITALCQLYFDAFWRRGLNG